MDNDDIKAQILADADELEFTFGSQYPPGSSPRSMFQYFANTLRREFSLTDSEKIKLVLKALEHAGQCTKENLVDRLDFNRDEGRRIVDLAIRSGLVETSQESTKGRPRILLQLP